MSRPTRPELLAPAGSPEALEAAITAGADAVYLGGSRHNARLNAHNFDRTALEEAVAICHRRGVRVYLTLNTLIRDRELRDALDAAYEAGEAGVDALIIADPGAAALIRRALPGLPLHASTQLSGHNAAVGKVLAPLGFSRFVIAREATFEDLDAAVRQSGMEVEVFIHGALCVSHSGQCLFSSLVGGRSGNRGACAQPCRLPYSGSSCDTCRRAGRSGNHREAYPLSLKDLSLASHVPTLLDIGVSSLKIEGRMKSPGYVSGVTAIWRRLLNEGRGATNEELAALGDLFSRGGLTDGYQVKKMGRGMMGIRSEADKERTALAEREALQARHPGHLPLDMTFSARAGNLPALTVEAPLYRQGGIDPHAGAGGDKAGTAKVTVTDSEGASDGAPLTEEAIRRQLGRIGGTGYALRSLTVDLNGGVSLPLSRLNALRREALGTLEVARVAAMPDPLVGALPRAAALALAEDLTSPSSPAVGAAAPAASAEAVPASAAATHPEQISLSEGTNHPRRTAHFRLPVQITPQAISYFDLLFLPLGATFPSHVPSHKRGVALPPVVFDREADDLRLALSNALREGVRDILVGNVGHLPLVREVIESVGLSGEVRLHGDFRLNVYNRMTVNTLLGLPGDGVPLSDLVLSPELTLPQMRDLARGCEERLGVIVYGRIPLMLLEKCAIREAYGNLPPATVCREICARNTGALTDRLGKSFPILRETGAGGEAHRNVVYNSLPLCLSDRPAVTDSLGAMSRHFLFSTEDGEGVDRVITAHLNATPLGGEVRRFVK